MRIQFCLVLIIVSLGFSCSPISKRTLDKTFKNTDEKFQDHTGFSLYDPVKKKSVYEYKSNRYFTPASNTKIFTLFSCLALLEDSVPALRYIVAEDSLIFWGTGDPSFLYKEVYSNDRTYYFLKTTPHSLYFSDANFITTHFGSGWAWDDYNDYYSAERSSFPIYGNILFLKALGPTFFVQPRLLKSYVQLAPIENKPKLIRRAESNDFFFHPSKTHQPFKVSVPFKTSAELTANLLSDTLKKIVRTIQKPMPRNAATVYSVPVDSLYKVMMQESDNFIAEQLLLLCSQTISDTLQPEIAIRHVKKIFFSDLPDEPRWVDGSGLSRYNLFTPRSIVRVWEKIYQQVPQERLFALLATGGRSGTLKNWYNADVPYIFGKTGSLSNNHSLSGYLITKKGRTLIFSFMNNNYTVSINAIRQNMQNILRTIYEKY